ncbi:MAG: RNA polymerase sigma factor [Cyclobacteriaceae bacterium]
MSEYRKRHFLIDANMTLDEKNIIKGCQKGDRKMQRLLYERYSRSMYAVALRYSKVQQEAEDITQEAFIKVFKNIQKFRQDSSLGYWIKRIVINTALNHQRSKLYLYPMVDVTEMVDSPSEELIISDFSHKELIELIRELPTGCQTIFNLYAIEGYKHHEIADMLEISEGTSKSQYSRAKVLLKEKVLNSSLVKYKDA